MTPPRPDLHLLEVGVRWPPETFLQWKLQRLASRGFRVSVASAANSISVDHPIPGIELQRMPAWRQPLAVDLAGICWDAAVLAGRDVARLRRLLSEARRPPVPPRRSGFRPAVRRLRGYLPLARLRPDVIHFEWESAAVHHLPLFDVWQAPVVVSCHGSGLNVHPYTGLFEHWVRGYETVFGRAAAVHVVSDAMRAQAELFGVDPADAWLIRPAVDPDFFRPPDRARTASDVFRIVSVGDLLWIKGHDYALSAIRALLDEGAPVGFDIVGGDPAAETAQPSEQGSLRFTIHDLGLDERVRLWGEVPSTDVRERLHEADVFVHASVSEGIPTVVLEAMGCGLPVVVTDCGGMREAVTDGVEGFVVPRRDTRAMASALVALWRDPELRERMGRAGRERVLREFTLIRQVDAFEALYRTVAARGGTRAPAGATEPRT